MSDSEQRVPFDWPKLFSLFRPTEEIPQYEVISAEEMPQPYRELLVHEHHMTVTLEAHHGDLVEVRILERLHQGDSYARKILLALEKSGRIVQFGIVHVDLSVCSDEVRAKIVEGKIPFGRILIQHNVLRRIEPIAYLKIEPGQAMRDWFSLKEEKPVYGRLAYIHYNEQPAVELLEVVTL